MALSVPVGYDRFLLECGGKFWTNYPAMTSGGLILSGASGSGKTTLLKLMLGRAVIAVPDIELYVCDFKGGSDFQFLQGAKRFWRYTDSMDGLNAYYERFKARQLGEDVTVNPVWLVFDELAGMVSSADMLFTDSEKKPKIKPSAQIQTIMATLAMLQRSFHMMSICCMQRMDTTTFGGGGSRENYDFIVMGNFSREVKAQVMSDFDKSEFLPITRIGQGVMVVGGKLSQFQSTTATDIDKLHKVIRSAVDKWN